MTSAPPVRVPSPAPPAESFAFVGDRLWLDFVNSADAARARQNGRVDALDSFAGFIRWLTEAGLLDGERAAALARRAQQQPTGASASLHEARRMRSVLRALAERGAADDAVVEAAMAEINRVLGRSAGTRRVEATAGGGFVRNFVTVGDVFAALLVPVIESAADALVASQLARVHRCGDPRCLRVFFDGSRNGRRRWCEMATCGNRAKAARHRRRARVR